ncbi:prenyltransferase, UbiA family protein [Cordyceps fumosorosea ARSEF 2679]|uniref:Prenyltransferase, UbiA family protein n=1 Tax=Cordyceps fumosorosea (strain ARSEF 2679) TaxID=1081104 RepID=A0A162MH85_CORFA|nr:prenyltransferase, UbiA family protein [Cordyceps fumosorosea ARSEF 2679]OAA56000.1 prenyltransferase, UbiA family protein [Cordyceps fumosorosea ARSEF 2679]
MSSVKTLTLTKTALRADPPAPPGAESRIAQKFGGHYAGDWMRRLPASWTPYIQLARLHRPHGLVVVSLSHLFGLLHAAFLLRAPAAETLRVAAVRRARVERPPILYYPFAKRQMFAPQLVLGACMGLAVLVGAAAMGLERPWQEASTRCLAGATTLWVVAFDTIYAHMDLQDDVKLGVNSLAVFVRGYARPVLAMLVVGMAALLHRAGVVAGMGAAYNGIAVAGCSLCAGAIVALLDLGDRASCGKWCIFGFRFTGISMVTGLLVTYLASL